MATYETPVSPGRSRYLPCKVFMLDDTVMTFDVLPKSLGKVLFEAVVNKLQLLEADYFGLEFIDSDSSVCWLDHEKPLCKQLSTHDINLRFLVKFYTPDPELLEEELTRYMFALQIKKDLASGVLFCQEHTAVLLASFVVQAEVGNYCDDLADQNYLSNLKLLPNQSPELEYKIMEHHREHIGQSAAEADFNLLDTARKVEVYGIRMYPVKDHDGIGLQLAVMHAGIVVFQNFTKINSFSWAKIRKLCFKRKKFIVKLHADGSMYSKDTVEFYCPSRNASKNFWKRCIEYHSFFRCHSAQSEARRQRSRSRVVSRGSSFRYCGRTQKELIDFVRDNYVSPAPFMRSTSMRTMSALNSRASTPRSGTLNSHRDMRFGSGVMTGSYSMATGSRTLDRSCPGSFDRSAGDRSRRYMSRGSSYERSCPGSFDQHHGDFSDGYDLPPPSWSSLKSFQRGNGSIESASNYRTRSIEQANLDYTDDGLPIQLHKIDPSQFMLSRDVSSQQTTSTIRSLQLGGRDDRSRLRSPEIGFPPPEPDSLSQREPMSTSFGPRSSIPNHQFHRQDRFEVTPNGSQEQPSPPVLSSTHHSILSDENSSSMQIRRHRMMRDQPSNATVTSKSTASTASFNMTSSASILSSQTDDSDDESKRKKISYDNSYYVVKELLMTERTYKKDLEVIAVWFQDAMSRVDVLPDHISDLLFNSIVPIYEFHCGLLKEIDQRVAIWEGKTTMLRNGSDGRKIGDLLLSNMTMLQWYRNHIDRHEEILEQLEVAIARHNDVHRSVEEFESQKVCYLSLQTFFLKPFQRLLHYELLLERLLRFYSSDHLDLKDCKACLASISTIIEPYREKLKHIQNWQKLIELQRDISGIDNIVQANRLFIREGCLQKLSHKGFQPRMFFLFSDILIYTSRSATPRHQFTVHGQFLLAATTIEEDVDARIMSSVPFCFSISSGNRSFVVAATSQEEKEVWVSDIEMAIREAKCRVNGSSMRILYPSLKSNSSSEGLDDSGRDDSILHSPGLDRSAPLSTQRLNTISHVCWHRSTTVGTADYQVALQNQMSGYLLRKFKNSNGWQKLWVVFTNFCLFFYKNFQDDFPLASLPVLGYVVSLPSDSDGIRKEFVFKLQFRNHVYFFRTDSEYTFQRWVEVISSATCMSGLPDPVDDLNADFTVCL